jgi:hypothetical protein
VWSKELVEANEKNKKKALLKRAVSPLGAESPVRRNPKDPQKNSNPPRHSLRNPKIYQKNLVSIRSINR